MTVLYACFNFGSINSLNRCEYIRCEYIQCSGARGEREWTEHNTMIVFFTALILVSCLLYKLYMVKKIIK